MKNAYRLLFGLLLALLTRPAAQAQNNQKKTISALNAAPTDSLREALDRVFAPLDKTQVPAAYLEEYGNRFASLTSTVRSPTAASLRSLPGACSMPRW